MVQPHNSRGGLQARSLGSNWKDDAACLGKVSRHSDPWFPEDDKQFKPDFAARYWCDQCPVRRECLLEALRNDEPYGVWGGLTRRQRVALCRPRNRAKCPICANRFLKNKPQQALQVCLSCGISWRLPTRTRQQ